MKQFILKLIYNKSSKIEERYFASKEEALKEYVELRDDKSGIYRFVAVLDCEANIVTNLLQFEHGQLRMDLYDGCLVGLREGYFEKGEEKYLYRVTDINENNGRCLIVCTNGGSAIPVAESVDIGMIEVKYTPVKI